MGLFRRANVDALVNAVVNTRHDPAANVAACRKALKVMTEREHGEVWAIVASIYAQALSEYDAPDLDRNVLEARDFGGRALKFCERHGLRDQAVSMRGLLNSVEYNFAIRYYRRKGGNRAADLESAIDHLERALPGYTAAKRQRPGYWADVQQYLAMCYEERLLGSRQDNLEKAIRHYKSALTVFDRNADRGRWAACMIGLATAYDRRIAGDHAENIELSLKTFQEARDVLATGGDPARLSSAEHGLGLVYSIRPRGDRAENIERAIEHLTAALTGLDPVREPENWASTVRALGAAYDYRVLGDEEENVERAIGHFEEALKVVTRERNPDTWAMTHRSLGLMYWRTHEVDKAIDHLREALRVRTKQRYPREWALTTDTLAQIYLERSREDVEQAIAWLRATVEMYDPFVDRDNWLNNRILLVQALRRQDAAKTLAERAELLSAALKVCPAGSKYMRLAGSLGEARADQGDWAAAVTAFTTALDALESLYLDSVTSEGREVHAEAGGLITRWTSYALAKTGRLEEAVVVLERGRARALGDALDLDRAAAIDADGLATVTAAVEPGKPVAYLNTTPWGTLTLLLVRRETVEIKPLWADFTADDLNAINFRSTADEPSMLGSSAVAPTGYMMRMLNLYETTFEDGNVALTTVPWNAPGSVARTAKEEGGAMDVLGSRVMAGLSHALAEADCGEVVLIPCGPLGVLPVHTASYGDDRYLLHDFDVTFAPSARVLTRARERLQRDWDKPVLAGVANPLPHPAPLEFATCELEQIARLFGEGTWLHGEQATKSEVLRLGRAATHVHLACHGSYELGDNAPHLQLAHAEQLTLNEIAQARPFADARLVVLSACQTAIVRMRVEDDVVGLPTAVMAAGTPGVIATLWAVDDLSTALLMDRFYTLHLRGEDGSGPLPPHRALRRAQRWLATVTAAELHEYFLADENLRRIALEVDSTSRYPGAVAAMNAARFGLEDPDTQPFANSYYWAPFVFIGA